MIQAAWSFCLALRARGLGTTWVTAALQDEARAKEILGIPEDMTEIVLLPVAWTKGTDFRARPRHPAREITYFDRFGTTFEHGPGDQLRFEDGPGVIVEIDIDARRRGVVAAHQTSRSPPASPTESQGADWAATSAASAPASPATTPRARRLGRALHGRHLRRADVVRLAHRRSRPPRRPLALRPRTRRHPPAVQLHDGPGLLRHGGGDRAKPEKEARILRRRLDEVQVNMQRTVDGIKALAES